jgi:hypothetical protein
VSSQRSEGEIKKKNAPITSPQGDGQNNNQSSQNPPSVIIQVATAPACGSEDKKENDYHLAVYTGMLAAFTGALVIVGILQFYMMGQHKKGLDGLLDAVDTQAKIANRSLILQFRPRVVIRGGFVNGIRLSDTKQPIGGHVQFVVTNAGGTDAHIYKSQFIVKAMGDSITESSLMDGATSIGEFSLNTGQGTTITIPISLEMVKNIQDEFSRRNEPLSNDRKPVYAIGNLWYKDDLGISRSTGIHRKFDPVELTFVPVENSTSEYAD